MINGKRIMVAAVHAGNDVVICTAPYLASIWAGDQVVVEGIEGFGTVLLKDYVTIDEEDYKVVEDRCELKRILRKVSFYDLKWDEEEEADE